MTNLPKLGIIAGGGTAPRTVLEICRQQNRPHFLFCLKGQADESLAENTPHAWLALGEASKLKEIAAREKIKEVVMIGRVRRPSLLELKPDMLALKVLTKIGMNMLGDDALLRAVGKAIEEEGGVRIIGAHEIFADLLTPNGLLTNAAPSPDDEADIARGFDVATTLGKLDVGQAVVVQQGLVLGVEAIEGTDALIARCATLRRIGKGAVLVKCAKPQQDNRYDLPTIGPETIEAARQAGLTGIVVESGRSLLVERERTIALANDSGLFIVGHSNPPPACGRG